MRIGMIAPPWFPLPPHGYGGIEFVVHLLTEGLVGRGHDVTLFASGDSQTLARLSYVFAGRRARRSPPTVTSRCSTRSTPTRGRASSTSSTTTTGLPARHGRARPPAGGHTGRGDAARAGRSAHAGGPGSSLREGLRFIAISDYQRQGMPDLIFLSTIPNAIDTERRPWSAEKDDYLLFIGRMIADKGAHVAVEVAGVSTPG